MNVETACGACGKTMSVPDDVNLGALRCPVCGSKTIRPVEKAESGSMATGYLRDWRNACVGITLTSAIVGGGLIAYDMPIGAGVVVGFASLVVAAWTFVAISTWMGDVLAALRSPR